MRGLRARTGRRATTALVVALAVGGLLAADAGVATAADTTPTGDAFYETPRRIAAAAPGDVLRSEPIEAPAGARAWRVLYRSESVAGDPIAVSGVIVAPVGRAPARRPVLTWAHGTAGLADHCAPSRDPQVATRLPFVDRFVAAGYVVAATDYEGLGTEGVHPYLVGQSEGRSVLDAARAARALRGTGAGREVLVAGHSQGGQAALFSGELAPEYAPELELRGVVAVAPATDLALLLAAASAIPQAAGYAVMAAAGFNAAYPEDTDPEGFLTPEAMALVDVLETGCSAEVVQAYQVLGGAPFAVDPRTTPPYDTLIAENTPGRTRTPAPVLLVHGTGDMLIPVALTNAFFPVLCAVGNVAELRTYEGAGHGTVIVDAGADILAWLDARRDGVSTAGTCA